MTVLAHVSWLDQAHSRVPIVRGVLMIVNVSRWLFGPSSYSCALGTWSRIQPIRKGKHYFSIFDFIMVGSGRYQTTISNLDGVTGRYFELFVFAS